MWYSSVPPHYPAGVYDHPSPVPGVDSVQLPDGEVSRFLRDATRFVKRITDLVPGSDDWLPILIPEGD